MWSQPNVKIHKLEPDVAKQQAPGAKPILFTANCIGFDPDAVQFVFIRGPLVNDLSETPPDAQLIPCEITEVNDDDPDTQEITFKASLCERMDGTYHLIGWSPMIEDERGTLANNATALFAALTVTKAVKK